MESGKVVTFFKYGDLIALQYKKKIFDPLIHPEHVRGIFKDYSEDQINILSNGLKVLVEIEQL